MWRLAPLLRCGAQASAGLPALTALTARRSLRITAGATHAASSPITIAASMPFGRQVSPLLLRPLVQQHLPRAFGMSVLSRGYFGKSAPPGMRHREEPKPHVYKSSKYVPRHTMKRRFRGLYGGKHIQFGNIVTFSHRKLRRTWKPNVQHKRYWSEKYGRYLQFRMTTAVLKKVKKLKGGIDEYIAKSSNKELLYPKAKKIKANQRRQARLEARAAAIQKMSPAERVAAGLPEQGVPHGWRWVEPTANAEGQQ